MSGNSFFLDTNALVYWVEGHPVLDRILASEDLHISVVTEMELLSNPHDDTSQLARKQELVSQFHLMELTTQIKEIAIDIRRRYRLKLPDAIIAASAIFRDFPLISADKDFAKVKELTLYHITPN